MKLQSVLKSKAGPLARVTFRKRMWQAVVTWLLLLAFVATPVSADGGIPTWPSNPDWQSYVPGPSSDDVKPVAITRFHGDVTNPEALLGGGGVATLTMPTGGQSAVIVLDYGEEVGGTPYIVVNSTSGSNSVRISTSEALPFLNANQGTSLARDAAASATNIKVASVAPFYAGTTITIDSGAAAETRTVTNVGTAAAPNSSLVLPAAAGDANVNVASVNGYVVGGPFVVGSDQVTITAVGTAAGAPTTIVYPVNAGDTNVKVASVAGFAPGQKVLIDTGAGMEVVTVVTVGTLATTTSLFSPASPGETNIKVTSVAGLAVGNEIDIEPGANQDHVTITNVGTAGTNSTVAAANVTSGLIIPAMTGANWIWNSAGAGTSTPGTPIVVRKTFQVADPSAVTSAVLRVNADDGHTTWVNGIQVSATTGANNNWQTSQITDIRSLLVAGTNVIASQPFNTGGGGSFIGIVEVDGTRIVTDTTWKTLPGSTPTPPVGWNTPGFDDSGWVGATITGAYGIAPWNQNVQTPASPTTLRVASVAGFVAGDTIAIDTGANREEKVISSVGTAGATGSGLTLSTPLSIVHAVSAPVLNLTRPGTGISFTPALANAHVVLATVASPGSGITFASPVVNSHAAGAAIRGAGSGIDFTPALGTSYAASTTVSSSGTGITFSPALTAAHAAGATVTGVGTYVNDNGAQINFTVTTPQTYTGALRGGFRFAAIELRTPGTVTLSAAGLNFKAHRATPSQYEGWFISSDDELNRMWYAGAYTAQMDMVPVGVSTCFTKPVIFDGAKRDRAIWSGDLMISDPVALLSIGSNAAPYVKGSIDAFLDLQQPANPSANPPVAAGRLHSAVGFQGCGGFNYAVTYSHYSAMIAIQYYRYTGDTAYITPLLPKLELATAYGASRLDANGLIVTNDNDYWQTRQDGQVTEYNLAYYELLRDMIWLESQIGTPEKVAEYTDAAAALKAAINSTLFNTSAGLYVRSNLDTTRYPLDANMNAIRLGVAPADKVQHILDYFKAAWVEHGSQITQPAPSMTDPFGHTIEPLNNTWEMFARLQSNDAAGALELMRRLWGLQVDPNSGYFTNTLWEFVLANGLPSRGFDSLAHAWGAGPTQVLTEALLGATPIDPGYETFQVKPQPVDIEWAEGQVPTAFGPMTVKWAQNTGTDMFHLEVTAPAGTSGEVWVPVGSAPGAASIALTPGATLLRRDGEYDVYSVGAGTFEFLTVNAPVAVNDSYSTNEDASLTIDATNGVLANDTDVESDPLTAALVSDVSHGVLTLNADGSFSYTPSADFNGSDSFTYQANDGSADSNIAIVTITVDPLNDLPSVQTGPDVAVDEGAAYSGSGSFSDVDSLTWSATVNYGDGSGTQPLTLNPDKTFDLGHTYADNGSFTVSVEVTDGDGGSSSDSLSVTVSNVAPTADAGPDQTANDGDSVAFAGSFTDPGSADTQSIHWDFGDGSTADGSLTPSHVYAAHGSYTATLTVTDDDGGTGNDSMQVNVAQLPPAAPSDLTATADGRTKINLAWTDNSGDETGFRIERSPAGLNAWASLNTTSAGQTAYPDMSVVCATAYDYRVIAINAAGDSAPSNIASAMTATCLTGKPEAPKITVPAKTLLTNDDTPDFAWTPVANADTYLLQIAIDTKFKHIVQTDTSASPMLTATHLDDGKYYVRVQGVNSLGVGGKWSSSRKITIDKTPPPPPMIKSPVNGSMVKTTQPMLVVVKSPGAVKYQFQVSDGSGFGSMLLDVFKSGTSAKVPSSAGLMRGVTYYWRVAAIDKAGNISAWSTTWSFTVKP